MNVAQRKIFNYISSKIKDELEGKKNEPIRLFITGGAATGKTFSLKLLVEQIQRCYEATNNFESFTRVTALTGVAARLIDGQTLHTTLKLPVQKDGKLTCLPLLRGEFLMRMRRQWMNVKFLIIDEISMVPYQMLCMIDSRLKQLKDTQEHFGGMNILVFGDLMQLPPVSGNPVFEQPEYMRPATHLWREFGYLELTDNMRQQGDSTFIDILNSLRIGKLTKDQLDILEAVQEKSKQVGDFAIDKALRIKPTKRLVDKHNNKVLNMYINLKTPMNTIFAQDKVVDGGKNTEIIDLDKVISNDTNKTGGLLKELKIFIGAKVMLRYNVDINKGLVNGSLGIIKEIMWPLYHRGQIYSKDIPSVQVDFGDIGIHKIDPISIQFPAKFGFGTAERRMLPLILCWSCTVHKMQGSTVEKAVVYLGKEIFQTGQSYVALSRVKSLEGLEIYSLDCSKLFGEKVCNIKAMNEIERLRKHKPKFNM